MPGLRVRLLGPFEVEGLEPHRLGPRKARTLLKMLALARGKPVTADYLIDCLWPEGPPAWPSSQLAVLVSRLRSTLGSELARTDAGYALAMDWLDVDAVAELADEADRRLAVGGPSLAKAAATAALALVRGPLLADELEASLGGTRSSGCGAVGGAGAAHGRPGRAGHRRLGGRRRTGSSDA